jgi:hypothetical protein
MDYFAKARLYPQCGVYGLQGCIYLNQDKSCYNDTVRTRLLYNIFIRSFYVVNF